MVFLLGSRKQEIDEIVAERFLDREEWRTVQTDLIDASRALECVEIVLAVRPQRAADGRAAVGSRLASQLDHVVATALRANVS